MRISTKSHYGLQAILYLARKNKLCSLNEITQEEKISFDYLEKLMAKLVGANLVKTKRGVRGGYFLAKKPEKISVYDVVKSLEDQIVPVSCLEENPVCTCGCQESCLSKPVWQKLNQSFINTLKSMTLADLLK